MIIAEHLLLDLPLNGVREGEWLDESGHGWSVRANSACEEDELALIGSCLHLKSGGRLTLADPFDGRLSGGELTVEFWALPDEPEELGSLLDGPLRIALKEGELEWSIMGGERMAMRVPPAEVSPDGVPTPHHWALVLDRRDPRASRVHRDGVDITRRPIAVGEDDSGSRSTGLVVGGSRERGWRGRLAHLRLWNTALAAPDIERNRARDVTAHAAFKAGTGIEWRLLNAHEEPTLYVHGSEPQMLHLDVINVLRGSPLVFEPGEAASRESYHFQLVFRPGTIADRALGRFSEHFAAHDGNHGWSVKRGRVNGEDYLSFLWTGTSTRRGGFVLQSGADFRLHLPGLAAVPGAGSRTTRVALNYRELYPRDTSLPMTGHRAQLLNILHHAPSSAARRPPLDVGVLGASSVLNNGTQTRLTLYVRNVERGEDGQAVPLVLGAVDAPRDQVPKFVLEIDASDARDRRFRGTGLADHDDLGNTRVSATALRGDGTSDSGSVTVDTLGVSGDTFRWRVSPTRVVDGASAMVGFEADETLLLTLQDLKTTARPGRVVLRLRYEDFERYGEGVFEVPVDKVAAIPARLSKGGAGYGLALGHDPGRAAAVYPEPEVMDEVLSVRQQGDGDAVRIESVGRGAALSVRHEGGESGGREPVTARFTGGSVEIDGDIHTKPTHTWYVDRPGWERRNRKFIEFEENFRNDALRGLAHLYAPSDYYTNVPTLTLAGNYGSGGKVGIGTTDPESSLHVNGRIRDRSGELVPVGTVVAFAGKSAPDGWLICRGQRLSDATKYADLARVLGKTLPFNLPNYQQRFIVGAQGSGEYALGATGGRSTVTLTSGEMPRHRHGVEVAQHASHGHRIPIDTGGGGSYGLGRMYKPGDGDSTINRNVYANNYWNSFGVDDGHRSRTHKVTEQWSGNGRSHENRPKFVALNYIIKY